ncbi:MAG TPA: hypothetical protein VFC45_01365 [Pseudolabrys sp.]|nr:hypothetical protein [Pseudolabrys sp.]
MPIPLPAKAAILSRAERWTVDWIRVWAFILGVLAVSLATLIYAADGDPVTASFVLIAFAAIIGVGLLESVQKHKN